MGRLGFWDKCFLKLTRGMRRNRKQVTGTSFSPESLDRRRKWIGARGETLTDLHPSGSVVIDSSQQDAISSEGYLEKGTPVEVVDIRGFRFVVKPIRVQTRHRYVPPKS